MAAVTKKVVKKWKDDYILKAYELARSGMSDRRIAGALGVSPVTFSDWLKKHKLLRKSLKKARQAACGSDAERTLKGYVYKNLSPTARKVWDKLKSIREDGSFDDDARYEIVDEIMASCTKRTMYELFLHALVTTNFSASEACAMVGITHNNLKNWILNSPEFRDVIREIDWHKGNFFESALFRLVEKGDSAAIIFANKTYNKKRGYSEKYEVEVTDNSDQPRTTVDDLDLPLEVKIAIRDALRRKKENQLALEDRRDVIDAEFEERHAEEAA